MTRYLLSNGTLTTKPEVYVADLIKLNMGIFPKDIPGMPNTGFNSVLSNLKKDEAVSAIRNRIDELILNINNKLHDKYKIELVSIYLVDETRIHLVVSVNQVLSDNIVIDIK